MTSPSAPTPAPASANQPTLLLTPLAPHELVWMENVREHLRPTGGDPLTLEQISVTFNSYSFQWHTGGPHPWDPGYLITALGVCLGDHIIALATHARWQRAKLADESSVAVRLDDSRQTVFPIAAVSRRWYSGERSWMRAWVHSLLHPTL